MTVVCQLFSLKDINLLAAMAILITTAPVAIAQPTSAKKTDSD